MAKKVPGGEVFFEWGGGGGGGGISVAQQPTHKCQVDLFGVIVGCSGRSPFVREIVGCSGRSSVVRGDRRVTDEVKGVLMK